MAGITIKDNVMYMTRGDYVKFVPEFENEDGTAWEMGENDTVTFTVRALPSLDSAPVICYISAPGTADIIIMPEDTAGAEPGKYSADMQVNHDGILPETVWPTVDLDSKASGKVKNYKNFIIMSEVSG